MSFAYLASPYSHVDANVREDRYRAALHAVKWCLDRQWWVYSPIVHCHDLAKQYQWRTDAEFWRSYNYAMLECATKLLILPLDGWEESKGLQGEVTFALSRNIPIEYLAKELHRC